MEADKRALTLDVQQQHQRLILHQALFFLDVRCVERSFPTDTDTNSIQQHCTADQWCTTSEGQLEHDLQRLQEQLSQVGSREEFFGKTVITKSQLPEITEIHHETCLELVSS